MGNIFSFAIRRECCQNSGVFVFIHVWIFESCSSPFYFHSYYSLNVYTHEKEWKLWMAIAWCLTSAHYDSLVLLFILLLKGGFNKLSPSLKRKFFPMCMQLIKSTVSGISKLLKFLVNIFSFKWKILIDFFVKCHLCSLPIINQSKTINKHMSPQSTLIICSTSWISL